MSLNGECACGDISITITTPPEGSLYVCHCTTCRKMSGTVGAYNLEVKTQDLRVEGELKEWVTTGSSGGLISRWFCPTCSSVIFSRDEGVPDLRFVRAGLFPPRSLPRPSQELFVKNLEIWQETYEGVIVKHEQ